MAILDEFLDSYNTFKKRELDREERAADRELKLLMTQMQMDFQNANREDTQEHQIKMYNQELIQKIGPANVELDDESGYMQPIEGYNFLDTPQGKQELAINDVNYLREHGLPISNENENREVANIHANALRAGSTVTGPDLSTLTSAPYFGWDDTPDALTTDDVDRWVNYLNANRSYRNQDILKELIDERGIIKHSDVNVDENNEPTVYDSEGNVDSIVENKIKVALQAYQDGVQKSGSFKTDLALSQQTETDLNIMSKQAMLLTGGPEAVAAGNKLKESAAVLYNKLAPTFTEDRTHTIVVRGNSVETQPFLDSISLGKTDSNVINSLPQSKRAELKALFDSITSITSDGSGIQMIAESLLSQTDQGREMVNLLGVIDPVIKHHISYAMRQYDSLENVKTEAESFLDVGGTEAGYTQLQDTQTILDSSGIRQATMNLRGLDEGTADYEKAFDQWEGIVTGTLRSIAKEGGKQPQLDANGSPVYDQSGQLVYVWDNPSSEAIYNKILQWIKLEESTYQLRSF